jgi:hypothetical protein
VRLRCAIAELSIDRSPICKPISGRDKANKKGDAQ